MSAVWVVGAVWVALAFGLALLLAGGIRLADARQEASAGTWNFAVDGGPSAAPRPAVPVLAGGEAASAPLVPQARRPLPRG